MQKDLSALRKRVKEELAYIGVPPSPWTPGEGFDVAIVGAGMAGLAAAFQLLKVGIQRIILLDKSCRGTAGPWTTYARMRTLRSGKELTGPAFDLPSLTFRAWYTAQQGEKGWEALGKIPNALWMNYLNWFREVLDLPVCDEILVEKIIPIERGFDLGTVQARKVILATGRDGFGGVTIPDWARKLPKNKWAHTTENIDFVVLQNRRVAVVGAGASAFDAAAVALEMGAHSVDLICPRACLHNINKFAFTVYPGFNEGYYYLPPREKCEFMQAGRTGGATPPIEALQRVRSFSNFKLIQKWDPANYDFIILGTGFEVDGTQQPELKDVIGSIRLWQEEMTSEEKTLFPFAKTFPYLGPHFQFLPKKGIDASFLKDLYCFNWGATMSHALLSSDIPGIGIGSRRLAIGIASDFFTQNSSFFLENLKAEDTEEFPSNFFIIN